MAEKSMEFKTALSVKECGLHFQDAVRQGQTFGSRVGGLLAQMMGGENLGFYTPRDDSPFAVLDDDQPAFSVGVAVPRLQGAHKKGSNIHMYVWDRGQHRNVALLAHHSFTGSRHATDIMTKVRSALEQ